MQAKKSNRRYAITKAEVAIYQAQGYDIYDDEGKLIQVGAGKTVAYSKYEGALKKIEKLKAEIAKLNKELKDTEKKTK